MIVSGVGATPFVPATITAPTAPPNPVTGTGATQGGTFADSLASVGNITGNADALATQVATGQLTDIHQFTAAAAKAQLGVELTVAVRNRAVEAYQDIMRMQV